MSTINAITTSQTNLAQQVTGNTKPAPLGRDRDSDNDRSGLGERGRAGNLVQNTLQTLSQLGLSSTNQVYGSAETSATDKDGNTDGSASGMSQDVRQALNGFMHSLFQALGQQSAGQTSATPGTGKTDVQSAYGNLPENLNNLSNSLGSGVFSDLQVPFDNLVNALAGGNGSSSAIPGADESAGSSNQKTLQDFLKTLADNLSSQPGASGNLPNQAGNLLDASV